MRVIVRILPNYVAIVSLIGCGLFACKNEVSSDESGRERANETAETSLVTNQKVAQSRYDEAAFRLEIAAVQPLTVGKSGPIVVSLTAKAPFHVNAEYPHRFKVTSTKGGNAPSSVVTSDPSTLTASKLELVVPVVSTQAGNGELEGELSFSVCTAEKCLMEKRLLKFAFLAN